MAKAVSLAVSGVLYDLDDLFDDRCDLVQLVDDDPGSRAASTNLLHEQSNTTILTVYYDDTEMCYI
jgi:hypothetical protein